LIAANRIAAGTDVDLATVGVGVGVKPGTPKPDLSSVDAVKRTLLAAKLVTIPSSTSGIWLMKELFPRLGIADKIHVKATPRGADASGMVVSGEADLTVLPISEVLTDKGVEYVGAFPAEIQFIQTFSAAVVAGAGEAESGKKLIEFLTSPRSVEAIKAAGLE